MIALRRLVALFAVCLHGARAEHWALIVAGSKGYDNYRHQADACHAYHVVRNHGIPAENVVLMMYDDVATAAANPFPGKLFNKPSNGSAVDVYAGCHVDYRGEDVTPENFLGVLMGDRTATKGKKVLGSGPMDRVFVNFVDHGARSFVMFPHGQMLTGKQLTTTLASMYKHKRYKELVFYVEACHAGSMFWSYQMRSINAYVTTAANGWEASFGTYCPPMDYVDGKPLNTCLGDLYSVNWMEDSDRTDLSSETLEEQYTSVKQRTSRLSHVQQYGSSRIRKEIVGDFQSNYDKGPREDTSTPGHMLMDPRSRDSAVEASDIALVLAFYKYLRSAPGIECESRATRLIQQIQERQEADRFFMHLRLVYQQAYGQQLPINNRIEEGDGVDHCVEDALQSFASRSSRQQETDLPIGFTSYSIKYAGVFVDLCAAIQDAEAVKRLLEHAMCESARDGAGVEPE